MGLQSISQKVKQQLDLYEEIGSPAEFSPLIKAARGEIVDINELKTSVIRVLGIMSSRLDNIRYRSAKEIIDKAINILQLEWLYI